MSGGEDTTLGEQMLSKIGLPQWQRRKLLKEVSFANRILVDARIKALAAIRAQEGEAENADETTRLLMALAQALREERGSIVEEVRYAVEQLVPGASQDPMQSDAYPLLDTPGLGTVIK